MKLLRFVLEIFMEKKINKNFHIQHSTTAFSRAANWLCCGVRRHTDDTERRSRRSAGDGGVCFNSTGKSNLNNRDIFEVKCESNF